MTLLFFVIKILAFKVIIYPNWLTQSSNNISGVHISSEFLDLEITDQEMIMKLYNLCKDTKIKNLEFDTSHMKRDESDGFGIVFNYKNNSSDYIECRTKDAALLKQPENALFWMRGEANEELLSLLLEMENSNNSQIKAEQDRIFTEVKECLEEYEQDFNKIINLAKEDKSSQKKEGGGSISITKNSLTFNNLELEEECLSLMKKTNVLYISFSQDGVSFRYKSYPEYLTSIIYNYNDDEKKKELLGLTIKKIKPFYYMECITLSNK